MSELHSDSSSFSAAGEIFPVQEYYRLTYDGRKIRCYLRLVDPARLPGTPPTAGALKGAILADCKQRGIVDPDARAITMAIQEQEFGRDLLIAEGREPVPGRDGVVTYNFRTDLDKFRLVEDKTGRVDWRELGLIHNVTPGEVVASATKPTPGRPGIDVFGRPVRPVPGQAARIRASKNIKVSEDGLKATAAVDGYVHLENLVLVVEPVYIVRGDVNFSVGNIDFNGTVRILGSVLEDFTVKARGDVLIDNDVEKGSVIADGKVYVRGSVLGKEGVAVRAGKDIFARIAVNATLEAKGEIHIAEELMNSTAAAGTALRLDGAKRRIMGGTVSAHTEVRVGSIGNEAGIANTTVVLRLEEGLLERAHAHDERQKHIELQCAQREGALAKLLALKEKLGRLTAEQYTQVRVLMEEVQKLRDEQSDCAAQAADLRQRHADQLDGRVIVEQGCYPGTTIVIHDVEYKVPQETGRVAFHEVDGEIVPSTV